MPSEIEAAERLELMGRRGDLNGVEAGLVELERHMTQLTDELAALGPGGSR